MSSTADTVRLIVQRAEDRYEAHRDNVLRETDRIFMWLLGAEWVFGIAVALFFSPFAWSGRERVIHAHVWLAVFLGGAIVSLPIFLALRRPGETATRHVVTVGQMLMSALLIHLSGGRIETHFHVFGSLAFIAYYRDWKVLLTGTSVVALDHLIRGFVYPESVYGVTNPEWWRVWEHVFWVAFIDIFLFLACLRGVREMRQLAEQGAQLEAIAESHWSKGQELISPQAEG